MRVKTSLRQKIKINPAFSGKRWTAISLLIATLFVSSLSALASEEPENGIFSLVFENDVFSNSDQHYTNGIRVSWLSAPDRTPDWAIRFQLAFPAAGSRYLPVRPLT